MGLYTQLVNGGISKIKPYQAGKPIEEVQRELKLDDVIKLASNENPFGMSAKAQKAALACLASANLYPDANGFYLKQKLHDKFGYDVDEITLGAGSNELINLLFQAYVNKDCNVVFPEYSFVVYPMETTVGGALGISVPLKNFVPDIEAMEKAVNENTRIVIFANPTNPIGTSVSYKALHDFIGKMPKSTLVVIDEAYNEFNRDDPEYVDTASWLLEFENLVISRTFSKAYGLAGLRVGYMLSNSEISSVLNRLRAPFNVNMVALAAATAALDDDEFIRMTVENNTSERLRYENFCRAEGIFMIPSSANFVTMDFKDKDGVEISKKLMQMGVIVRPLQAYGLKSCIRVSIGLREENDRFFASLKEILKTM
jgi:histidinol-phosphate aminotransferase